MRSLPFPNDKEGSHGAVLDLVADALRNGLEPNILAVLLRQPNGNWMPVCGRFDLARRGNPAPTNTRPKGNVRVIDERLDGAAFTERLSLAMRGGAFRMGDVDAVGHGMDDAWQIAWHPHAWEAEGTTWPCKVVSSNFCNRALPYMSGPIEADGDTPVFDGLQDLLHRVMRFQDSGVNGGIDMRFARFQVVIWDERGRIEPLRVNGTQVHIQVAPSNDSALKLVGVVSGAKKKQPVLQSAPSTLLVELGEPVLKVNVSLNHGDDTVAERVFDSQMDAAIFGATGRVPRSFDAVTVPVRQSATKQKDAPPKINTDPPAKAPIGWKARWTEVRPLGRGGQAETKVVKASDGSSDVERVLKVLHQPKNEERRGRMSREIRFLRGLKDPGFPFVVDAFEGDERTHPYLVMELVPGGTLEQAVTLRRFTLSDALALTKELLRILDLCHADGLVHRDIKPDNIVLREGSPSQPVLLDFGLAVDIDGESDLTGTEQDVGNRFLHLPELHSPGDDKRDRRSDLTSCCGILLYVLTGSQPKTLADGAERKPHERALALPHLEGIEPGRLARLVAIFDRAFRVGVDQRWQDARELLDALHGIGAPVVAGSPGAAARTHVGLLAPVASLIARNGLPVAPISWRLSAELSEPFSGTKAELHQALIDGAVSYDLDNYQRTGSWPRVLVLPGARRGKLADGTVTWAHDYTGTVQNQAGDEQFSVEMGGNLAFQRDVFFDSDDLVLDFGLLAHDVMCFLVFTGRYLEQIGRTSGVVKIDVRIPESLKRVVALFHAFRVVEPDQPERQARLHGILELGGRVAIASGKVASGAAVAAAAKSLLDRVANEFELEPSALGFHGSADPGFMSINLNSLVRLASLVKLGP